MSDNNKPSGWGQNKNLPDSWGNGDISSPWGNKKSKPPVNEVSSRQPKRPSPDIAAATAETNETVNNTPTQDKLFTDASSVSTVPYNSDDNLTVKSEPEGITDPPENNSNTEPEIASAPSTPPPAPQRTVEQPQRFGQPAPPPPPVYSPPAQNSGNMQYYPQTEKKSKTGIIIGVIIAILLAVIAVLLFMFLRKSDDKSGSSSDARPAVVTEESNDLYQSSAASESTTLAVNSTTTKTEIATSTTTAYQIKEFPASDINNYPQYVEILKGDLFMGDRFALYDLNNDDTPELIITDSTLICYIYSIIDEKAEMLIGRGMSGTMAYNIYKDGSICWWYSSMYETGTVFYKFNGSTQLEQIDSYMKKSDDSGITTYYHGDSVISQYDYEQGTAIYGERAVINSILISDVIQKQEFTLEEYNDTSNLTAVGKLEKAVTMRKSPSITSDAIVQIPQGAYVGILFDASCWKYVKYYADTNSPIYYGYIYGADSRFSDYKAIESPIVNNGGDNTQLTSQLIGKWTVTKEVYTRLNVSPPPGFNTVKEYEPNERTIVFNSDGSMSTGCSWSIIANQIVEIDYLRGKSTIEIDGDELRIYYAEQIGDYISYLKKIG